MAHKSVTKLQKQLQEMISISPLQRINHPLLLEKQITLSVKRDDLLHTHISGNKWRKLKYNLIEARKNKIYHILSFGGAYSNHIHALAASGFYFGFKTTGIIRGEVHYANNPTLKQAQQWGMELHFVTRKEYKQRNDKEYLHKMQQRFPNTMILPEGGSNALALTGIDELCQEILTQTNNNVDHVITAIGSGATLAGLIAGFSNRSKNTKITAIAVLKEAGYLNNQVLSLLQQANKKIAVKWTLHTQYHGGGYAKVSTSLSDFCHNFEKNTNIPIEPIYTGKMFSALFELIEEDYFQPGEHIVALHTGGLQGRQGLQQQKLSR